VIGAKPLGSRRMKRNNENGFETLDVLFILLIIFLLLGVMLLILL
jgi:hypothetical protein